MREYYIRREGDEDASGPYNIDQITSLFEAGKLEKEAFVYDIDGENWIPIEECSELMKAGNTRYLLVLDDGELVGLVSMGDVIRALLAEREAEVHALSNYVSGSLG